MKYIVAIIQPDKLDEVLQALENAEIHLVTVTPVLGRGRQKGISEVYRSHKIAVNDTFVKPVIDAITKGAKSGEIGDGKIFVLDLEQCVRIRTGEQNTVAIG